MNDLFDSLRKKIEKNVKGSHVSILSDSEITSNRYWVKTPALDLNRILSGSLYRGIQSRNLVGIVGPEHTFKSSFMVLCMAEAQKQEYKVVIIDTEGGITDDFCKRWGLDPEKALYVYTPWISEVKSVIAQIKSEEDEGYVIGIDSAGGLDRIKSYDDAVDGDPKADQGLLQKEIRSTLKLLLNVCIRQNSIGIVCGHMYGMPSRIPMPDQIGGGKAMKLFPSVLIELKKKNIVDSNKDVTGNTITATTLKNRHYPPFQTGIVSIDYKNGIQSYAGMIDLGERAGFVKVSGSWYEINGDKFQGKANAEEALSKMPEFMEKLDEWLKHTGYSTINQELKEAEEMMDSSLPEDRVEDEQPKKKKIKTKKK